MIVRDMQIVASPLAPSRVRLQASVSYDDPTHRDEVYWFDVPSHLESSLSGTGNPWLACLLPLAVALREPLRIERPVCAVMLANVVELQRVWASWYSNVEPVEIHADTLAPSPRHAPARVGALFSGGIDSFFSVLRNDTGAGTPPFTPVDELIFLRGWDVPLANVEGFHRARSAIQRVGDTLGKQVVDVAANFLVADLSRRANLPRLGHGAVLASVALALENRYSAALIGASMPHCDLGPWGSHPVTDPLLSTGRTRIVHDGASFTRMAEATYIGGFDVALRSLRVCWKSEDDRNCGTCVKYQRTMLMLEVSGALDRCSTFAGRHLDLELVRRIYSPVAMVMAEFRHTRAAALGRGRHDIVSAIDDLSVRTARIKRGLALARALSGRRLLWRCSAPLERSLLAGAVR